LVCDMVGFSVDVSRDNKKGRRTQLSDVLAQANGYCHPAGSLVVIHGFASRRRV